VRRGGYLALAWAADDPVAAERGHALGRRLGEDGSWRAAASTDRLSLWTRGAAPPPVRPLPLAGGVIVGDLYPRPGAGGVSVLDPRCEAARRPDAMARRLSRDHWGGYLALLHGPGAEGTQVFRDPSGAWDCLVWALGDRVSVVTCDLGSAPAWLRPRQMALDWDAVAAFVAAPTLACHASLIEGVRTVTPGDLVGLGPQAASTPVWRPADFVGSAGAGDLAAIAGELVRRVDAATQALVSPHEGVLVELSGGLDSAIVAGALGAVGLDGRVRQWLNRFGDRPEGDERAYAGAVVARLGAELSAFPKPFPPLADGDFAELAGAAWPALNGADAPRDRDMARRLTSGGATAIVSGQGGDAIFLQMPSVLVAADEFRRRGWAALGSRVLADVARRNRTSVWSVLAEVHRGRRGSGLPAMTTSLVARGVAADADRLAHPWDPEPGAVDPGKRLQIRAIANSHLDYGDCRRRRAGDLIYPLLAQPVVELCLSIPTPDLAGGAYDRPFARAAFADRIPDCVRQRRYKGTLTSYFARWVAGSLDALRPYLLDGCLCAAGVLDRKRLEQALDPAQLILQPEPADILNAAMAEAWVRHWQGLVPDSARAPRRKS